MTIFEILVIGHPGPGVVKSSVTGLMFSYNEDATRYAALIKSQQPWVELIESLQKTMEWNLRRFIKFRKLPPRKLIFFQDDVLEREYNTVATAEIEAIQGTSKSIH